jgi:UDP-N-acetylglucosamine transferase subunit ALG13
LIFVTVGTTEQPFDRLMKAVDELDRSEPLVVQYGHSTLVPRDCEAVKFMGFDEMRARIVEARVVLCHAGAGSVLNSLCFGKRPIAAPRLRRFGEMVDDHQVDLLETFEKTGSVIRFMPGDDLATKIAQAGDQGPTQAMEPTRELVSFMTEFVNGGAAKRR